MASSFSAVQHQLRAATLRIAHAHDFSKTSNLAISVLVDLLSGLLESLASASVAHAQLAGRASTNFYDALAAFEELGIDVYEVIRWCRREGPAFLEYQSTLPAYPNSLAETIGAGLSRRDGPSVILEYREVADGSENSPELSPSDIVPSPTLIPSMPDIDMSDAPFEDTPSPGSDAFSPSPSATNPLSNMAASSESAKFTRVHLGRIAHSPLYQEPASYAKSTAAQELFVRLPEPPDRGHPLPTTSTHPFLLVAMQSAQENMTAGNANPSRLTISSTMSAAAKMRYGASDSLFSSSLPPPPRCLAPAPSHPIPQNPSAPTILLPPPQPRSIQSPLFDALDPSPGSLSTHMNALAERVIKPAVYDRASMILPPIAFVDSGTPQLYGDPVRAPWNKANGQQSRSDKPSGLTDALLYKTWPAVRKKPEEDMEALGMKSEL